MSEKNFHYIQCGLDNIFLKNGYNLIYENGEEMFSIENIDGLHDAIGKCLITQKKELSSKEIRFLRHEMLMSQKTLAEILGVTEQTVHRWEKSKTEIPKSSDRLLRIVYLEIALNKNEKIAELLKSISHIEEQLNEEPLCFSVEGLYWSSVA